MLEIGIQTTADEMQTAFRQLHPHENGSDGQSLRQCSESSPANIHEVCSALQIHLLVAELTVPAVGRMLLMLQVSQMPSGGNVPTMFAACLFAAKPKTGVPSPVVATLVAVRIIIEEMRP